MKIMKRIERKNQKQTIGYKYFSNICKKELQDKVH